MLEIKFEIIEMPDVAEVKATSTRRAEEITKERIEREERDKRKAFEDIPRFIKYINSKIDEAKNNGSHCINFNFNSEGWVIKDPRCDYTFKGCVSYELVNFVQNIYTDLGFEGYISKIDCLNSKAYRDGQVYLHW